MKDTGVVLEKRMLTFSALPWAQPANLEAGIIAAVAFSSLKCSNTASDCSMKSSLLWFSHPANSASTTGDNLHLASCILYPA